MVYTDPTTGEYVAEYATRDSEGNVTRSTEWFALELDAIYFSRTGQYRGSVL